MKYILKHKDLFTLILIILLALFLRTILLDRIPIGITNDEVDYIVKSKSVFNSVVGFVTKGTPLRLIPSDPITETTYLLIAPVTGPLPFSLFNARILYGFYGTLFVLLLYLISKKLFDKNIAAVVAFVAATNPWSIFIGRTSFESQLAMFFYFLGFYLLLVLRKRALYFSLLPFILAFYSYQGTKLLFLPFILLSLLFSYFVVHKRQDKNVFIGIFLVSLLSFLLFILSLHFISEGDRIKEISTPFSNRYSQVVNTERRLSVKTPLTSIFENKPMAFLQDTMSQYLGVFSPVVLFVSGDPYYLFSSDHGFFYYTDMVFLFIGFFLIYKKHRKTALFLTGLIIIAPVASALSHIGITYVHRSVMLFPILFIFIGYALYSTGKSITNTRYKILFTTIIALLYVFQVGNYLNAYLFQNPVNNPDQFSFQYRLLASYVARSNMPNKKIIIISNEPREVFKQYVFYTNTVNDEADKIIQRVSKNDTVYYKNMTLLPCAMNLKLDPNTEYIIHNASCPKLFPEISYLSIPKISEGATLFRIYNDILCSTYTLGRYSSHFTLKDFLVEKLNNQQFCQTFITNLPPK